MKPGPRDANILAMNTKVRNTGATAVLSQMTGNQPDPLGPAHDERPEGAVAPLLAVAKTDTELVRAVREGDSRSFDEMHRRYAAALTRFCTRLLGCPDHGQDAVQQTFLKAHRNLLANDKEIILKPWLYTIARNECITVLRRRQRRPETVELDDDIGPHSVAAAEHVEAREDLRETMEDLNHLPDEQRQALILTGVAGASTADVAQTLGCDPAKVKSLVFRARAHLLDIRSARATDCEEIRDQIAEQPGALRRRIVRAHVRECEPCRSFAGEPPARRLTSVPGP